MLLEGLFICGQNEAIPLKSLSVRAFLQGYLVGFRSTLTYQNDTSNPLEVFFRTPVDDSYAVVGLEAQIDGRKIRAEVQEKEKAKKRYEDAISRGRTAAFGEEKKGDIFSLVLGNLPPGEKAVLQLTMVGELAVEPNGAVRFVLPTVLKPRYTPSGSTDPLSPATSTSGSTSVHHTTGPSEYEFNLVINGAAGIEEVTSPSHEIRVENADQNINVSLAEDKQTDIVILVQPVEAHKPLVIVEPGWSNGENDFEKNAVIMVSFFPEFKGDTSCLQAACEFVFVVDRSGSMDGSYIKDAAQTLLLFLKSIPEGCYFNVVGFGSRYERLFPESVPYNQENLEIAVKHAENLKADLGGTELFEPLKDIFSHAPMKGLPRQVFVLTDGSVSNTESVIKLVGKNSDNSRCFSFGIGSGASSALVKGIAEAGKGAAEYVTTGERMQAKVIRSLKKAMQPAVTNTQVSYTVPDGVTVSTAPKASLPPIFIGERLIIYAMLYQSSLPAEAQEGSVRLTGDLLGAKVQHDMKFQVPLAVTKESMLQVSTIHHLAAKKLIKEMELEPPDSRRRPEGKAKIIQLSCDSNVISSLTAFIAIDEERKEAVEGSLETWNILPECEEYKPGIRYRNSLRCRSAIRSKSDSMYDAVYDAESVKNEYFGYESLRMESKSTYDYDPILFLGDVGGSSTYGRCSSGDSDNDDPVPIKVSMHPPVEDRPKLPSKTKAGGMRERFSIRKIFGRSKGKTVASASSSNTKQLPGPRTEKSNACDTKQLPSARRIKYKAGGSTTKSPLERIINLQLASGAWRLTAELLDVIAKTSREIKDACPVPCQGEMETIWATIIVLMYLQLRQSNLKDEWELVAAKAEAWLTKQNLPQGFSTQVLREKGTAFLS